ncbi:MAG: hypothetical protein QOI77_645 [Blastocatellia bacterium]|nr:hypothetical protein [Blastocatellia bacterium]
MALRVQPSEIPIAHSVAIMGLGPKGLYCLERLLAEFNARPLRHGLHIHLFNRFPHFGASPIYDPDQPDYILVNISVGEIDLWDVTEPPAVAGRGDNFVDWYQAKFDPPERLTGDEYLSRAVVGRYLIDGFQRILKHVPGGVRVSCHIGEVIDIRPEVRNYEAEFVAENGHTEYIKVDKVLLATGHSRLRPGPEEQGYEAFAAKHSSATFIPFVYPVVESMVRVPAKARVAMLGVGLTFIDAVLELTEGRGGRFERSVDGFLSYIASGKEPRSIIPFSRTGLPMAPKAFDLPTFLRPLTFFTADAIAQLRGEAPDGKLDFEKDLWPLFELEMQLNYYRVMMGAGIERERLESCGNDAQAMLSAIESYHRIHPSQRAFDYKPALDPVGERRFATGEEFTSFIAQYLEHEIAFARAGQAGCAVKAALDIWYEVRKTLGSVLRFGGLTPESHRRLIEHYFPRLKRVVFGPPIINIEKLLALLRAGLLDFSVARSPRVVTDEAGGCFELRCDRIPGAVARAEILVDARYPRTNIPRDATPLFRNLFQRGMVRAYENRSFTDEAGYSPGAIDMTEGTRFVVNDQGIANEDIAVVGIPTEGNLVGNLTLARDDYSATWAAEVMKQLRAREQS